MAMACVKLFTDSLSKNIKPPSHCHVALLSFIHSQTLDGMGIASFIPAL